jgi:hypothetical protein
MDGSGSLDGKVAGWVDLEKRLRELRDKFGSASNPLLFRGHSNSEWKLTTTLDRVAKKDLLFSEYYQLICGRMGPEVKTFAGGDVPEYAESVWKKFADRELLINFEFPPMDLYRYMVYLRHFGFPSPLLDWSRSPYVAAFFAFRDEPVSGVTYRSIYAYCKTKPGGVVGLAVGEPTIHPIGPYVQSHQRHFRQRCDYTICARFDTTYEQWRFDSDQKVIDNRRPNQDYLWKFDVPSTERENVLRMLNDYNLNAFSLFGSEESLLETMWLREYILRERLSPS